MSLKVVRLYKTLPITPDACSQPGWSIHLKCPCGREREFMAFDRLRRRWSDDMADVFAQSHFRCACGCEATEMRVVRASRDHTETLLRVTKPSPPGQPSHEPPPGSPRLPPTATPPPFKLKVRDH